MADQNLNIKVTTTADTKGIRQTAEGLSRIEKASKTAGATTEKAAGKASAAFGKLKEGIKGAALQVPYLGRFAEAVTNPVVASFGLMTAAATIFWNKLKAVDTSFGKAKWGTEQINAAAQAWREYGAELAKVKADSDGLAANLRAIGTMAGLIKGLGADTSGNPLFARRQAESEAAARKSAAQDARRKAANLRALAEAADPKKDANWDANTQSGLDADAAQAEAEMKRLDDEIRRIEDATGPAGDWAGRLRQVPERIAQGTKYAGHTNPEDILATLRSERSGYQATVDRARKNRQRNETRAAARSTAEQLRRQADEMEGQAASWDREAGQTTFDAQLQYYAAARAQGVTPNVTPTGAGFGVAPQVKAYFDKANADLAEIGRQWSAATAALREQAKAEASRNSKRL